MRVFALCCVVFTALLAGARTGAAEDTPVTHPNLTILLNYEHPYAPATLPALEQKLRTLLSGSGLRLEIRDHKDVLPREQFADVLVFNMKGHCSMTSPAAETALPVGALSDERGPLAMAYSADGNILPFGEVECDRVRASLQRVLGRGAPDEYQTTFGTALGTVLAHEVYHMLSHDAKHTKTGVTKESLSGREMLSDKLILSDKTLEALSRSLAAGAR